MGGSQLPQTRALRRARGQRSTSYRPALRAYFERIRYPGSREPTLATLEGIAACHVPSIPFENLDVLLGRDISLDPAAVEHKLVRGGRGGYCSEQNSLLLLLHVLGALGFSVLAISRPRAPICS